MDIKEASKKVQAIFKDMQDVLFGYAVVTDGDDACSMGSSVLAESKVIPPLLLALQHQDTSEDIDELLMPLLVELLDDMDEVETTH